jgi:voltage-gated potassium channel
MPFSPLTKQQRRVVRYAFIVAGVVAFYIGLVYLYFQVEPFGTDNNNIALIDAVWYVFLNPTGLGDAGALKLFPATLTGKAIGVIFALSGLSLVGLFVGKVTDMFNEYREARRLGYYGTDFQDHVVIIGWDEFSRRVIEDLVLSDVQVAVVTNRKDEVEFIYEEFGDENVFVLYADYENYDQLSLINIEDARQVFLNRTADTDTLITLLNFNNEFSAHDLRYLARVKNDELLPAFDIDGVRAEAVSTFEVASALIASHIFEPAVATFGKDLIASVDGREDYELQQYLVTPSSDWAGSTYGAVYWTLYEDHGLLPLGLSKRSDEGRRQLVELPDDDEPVEAGDYVVLIASGQTVAAAEEQFGVREGEHL